MDSIHRAANMRHSPYWGNLESKPFLSEEVLNISSSLPPVMPSHPSSMFPRIGNCRHISRTAQRSAPWLCKSTMGVWESICTLEGPTALAQIKSFPSR